MSPVISSPELFHIMLIEPQDSLNIGSVARAMMNLGFKHLHLVRPGNFSLEKALVTGRWAEPLIRCSSIHDSLSEALGTMQDVIGFSSLSRPHRGEPTPLPEWIESINARHVERTALLFGREDTGLTTEAIEQCRMLVRIPSHHDYPAFNLAQSALLTMYELSRFSWDTDSATRDQSPTWNQYERLDQLCSEVMVAAGFRHHEAGDPTAASVKNMLRRIQMNEREMRIMLALFNRVRISLGRGQ
jgi:tRNA/rRNA methyltransferase